MQPNEFDKLLLIFLYLCIILYLTASHLIKGSKSHDNYTLQVYAFLYVHSLYSYDILRSNYAIKMINSM